MNNKIKILTDIKIDQCPSWSSQTNYLLKSKNSGKHDGSLVARFCALLKCYKMYDVVITADIKTAQLFGIIKTIFKIKKPKHIILELMLDQPKDDIRWKIKNFLQSYCFASVDVIFVSARSEIMTYSNRLGISEDRIKFLPFHTNIVNPEIVNGNRSYILSAGKTGRDYATLARAVEGLKVKVVVVSNRNLVHGIDFPPNVEVHIDIPYEKYLYYLYNCSLVVVPLRKHLKSTGQVVFLEAMALGKPIIATSTTGTEDYIENGVTGILVSPGDSEGLRRAISEYIQNPSLYSAIALNAFEQVKDRHTFNAYTSIILNVAKDLVPQR